MTHHLARLLAGTILAFLALTTASWATPVTVRIEGNTLAGSLVVNTTGSGVPGVGACGPNSAGEALDKATLGNWDRSAYVSTILGETHDYSHNDYWAFWVNGTYSQVGLCDYTVQPGDELLFYPQVDGPGFAGTVFPLYFSSVPSTVVAGAPYTVAVIQRTSDGSSTTTSPAIGATVSDGSSSAVTDSSGRATLTAPLSGPIQLVASQGSRVNSPRPSVAVVAVVPTAPTPGAPTPVTPAPTSGAAPGPTPAPAPVTPAAQVDTRAPIVAIHGLRNREHFRKGRGPRELKGSITDNGSVRSVDIRLSRASGRRCFAFGPKHERFGRLRCSRKAAWFSVGSTADWSYLLPHRLRSGLYQLQVRATDGAGNRSTVQSVRFRVA
jgi:hypothetical protein